MSLGDVSLNLSEQSLVLVEGENNSVGSLKSNGSGKSCIFEAIYWVLTGKTIRGSKDIINKYYGRKYASVKLVLRINDDEYLLSRYREHPDHGNNLIIVKNGENISGSGVKKSEQVLATELPFLTEDLIGSVIVLGQGMPSRFTNYDPAGRKEILEVLSGNLGIIEEMKQSVVEYKSVVGREVSEADLRINGIENFIDIRKNDIKKLVSLKESTSANVSGLKEEIDLLLLQMEKSETDRENYKGLLDKTTETYLSFFTRKPQIEIEISRQENLLVSLEKDLSAFKDNKCPTCGQDLPDDHLSEEKKTDIINGIKEAADQRVSLLKELEDVCSNLNLTERKKKELEEAYGKVNEFTRQLDRDIIEKQGRLSGVRDYDSEIDVLTSEIKDYKDRLAQENADVSIIKKKFDIADYLFREIGRDFRGYLLKGVVDYINTVLKEFSVSLFGNESLGLILEDNKIFIEYDGRSYESLSGGEKHRADLSMQFALREMLIKDLGYTFNILVLDEIFDNLDERGVESLIRFLTDNVGEIDSVFVVTHHPALDIPFDSKLIAIKGIDNVTEVVTR